jgi:hypothetical protein
MGNGWGGNGNCCCGNNNVGDSNINRMAAGAAMMMTMTAEPTTIFPVYPCSPRSKSLSLNIE